MAALPLSMAVVRNPRSAPIMDGAIRPEGIELTVSTGKTPGEIFWRQLHFKEFDIAEMSLSEMFMLVASGDPTWVMLPVFMTRRFFHTDILVREDAGIHQPVDLHGKRVGVAEYIMTAAVWIRGALKDEFGVDHNQLDWHQGRSGAMSHIAMFGLTSPAKKFQFVALEKDVGSMMANGELDATLFYNGNPNLLDRNRINLRQHKGIRPLFPKPRAEQLRYYNKTGVIPINHGIIIRRSVLEQHPWVALNLFFAFVRAKEQAMARTRDLVQPYADFGWISAETMATLDRDPFPYGIKENRKALETCARYMHEQGLTADVVPLERVFTESTMDF